MTNKYNYMQDVLKIFLAASFFFIVSSCTNGTKEKKSDLNDKKAQLEKLKEDQKKLNDQIAKLEGEITLANPAATTTSAKLVNVMPLAVQNFDHYIELQGRIDSKNISYPVPRNGGGQVTNVYVKEGDFVRKGQLLVKLDDAVLLQNLSQLQSQLDYAKNIYDRQKNLWDQGIGTEVQYVTAKNNVTQIEKQIATLNEQISLTSVRSEVDGVADVVNIHPGEIFMAQSNLPNNPVLKIVNTSNLRAIANIPENYISRVHKGSAVLVVIPDLNNKTINSTVSLISQSIDINSRSFAVEATIKNNDGLKPNQVATIKILDYSVKNTIVVPVNTVQTDENGKYVYVMEKNADKIVARKKSVVPGESYGDMIEIKSGLVNGDQLITAGYQDLYEGQVVASVKS
jgi:RND family efflux transporter MFP subunit